MTGFYEMLEEYNINFDSLKEYLKSEAFLKIAGPVVDDKNENYKVAESDIDGLGIFSNKEFSKGDIIGYGRFSGTRTLAGRYTNHSDINNANFYYIENSEDAELVCEKDISIGEEILVNYRNHLHI